MSDPSTDQPAPDRDRASFDRTASARAAVDVSSLPAYGLDAVYASAQALATARRLAPYRSDIAALPGFDIGHLDQLEDLANALLFTQVTLVARANRVRQLPTLATEGYSLRALLLAYADLLVLKGRTPAEPVARLREGGGYRDLVEDLAALVRILREAPDAVGPAAPVTAAEIDRAAELARAMTLELGADSDPDLPHHTILLERQKLGMLLARAQGQLRRAVAYLRFDEGDAVSLVPSLYIRGARGRRAGEPDEAPEEAAPLSAGPDPSAAASDSPFET
ncbi:MAG: hypothetical protein V4850_37385 [Myxococcota bacterium]